VPAQTLLAQDSPFELSSTFVSLGELESELKRFLHLHQWQLTSTDLNKEGSLLLKAITVIAKPTTAKAAATAAQMDRCPASIFVVARISLDTFMAKS
jgi:hypothetical protein